MLGLNDFLLVVGMHGIGSSCCWSGSYLQVLMVNLVMLVLSMIGVAACAMLCINHTKNMCFSGVITLIKTMNQCS